MSFSFDKPGLRERTRGKSGDEFLEEMLQNLKQKNKNFFDSHPKWKTSGFPFEEGVVRESSAGGSRSNLQTHLADLVARHPELADSFVDLLPEEQYPETKESKQKSERSTRDSQQQTSEINKPPQTTTQGTQTGSLETDIKLRNTVPDMQSSAQNCEESNCDNDRSQRSQSAPPQTSSTTSSRQKEEGIRLIPIRTDVPQSGQNFQNPSSQHFHQQNSQHQQFPEQRNQDEKGPVVRHIPIFVEGRDEPILPKDAPSVIKRGGCQGKAESASGKKNTQPEEKQPPQQNNDQPQVPLPPHPSSKPDPLTQVAYILKEVEELSSKVNEWKGTSRAEKEYIYLDEMLTRNLLKLDNIETEGREEVRNARKDVIRRIQAAISILESKSAEGSDQKNQIQPNNEINTFNTHEANPTEPMEMDASDELTQKVTQTQHPSLT